MCPIVTAGQLKGIVVVETSDELPIDLTNTLETLAAQVGLALDREELTEAFHARRSESRFQTLVQSASDVILIARPDTTITYQTPSALRILGYEPGALEGKRLTSLLHPNDVERAIAAYGGVAFRSGTSVTAEWRVRHGDGSWRYVEVVTNNLLGEPTVEGIVLTFAGRDGAQAPGGGAQAPGLPRRAERPGQPGAVPGPPRARPGPGGPVADLAGRAVPGPGRLQARQRQPGPRRRRRAAGRRWPGACMGSSALG